MRYSQMTPEQRQLILENRDNCPLRVYFLGKAGILSYEEVAFLRLHNVDFDVDDRQVTQILVEQESPTPQPQAKEDMREPKSPKRSPYERVTRFLSLAAAAVAVLLLLRRGTRPLSIWRTRN